MIITVTLNPAIDRILDVPGFRARQTLKGRVVAVVPAGKGVNVSRYLDALGVASVASGFVGSGELGAYEASFAGTRVTPAFVPIDAPTRVNTTLLGGRGKRETHIREEGFVVPIPKRAALRRALQHFARKGNMFVFAGSLPLGYSVAEFARLIGALRRRGAEVAVDTSGPALRAAVAARVDLLSPNEDELRKLAVSRAWLVTQVGAIAVKRGAKGGRLFTRDSGWTSSSPLPGELVRNTVGAGDAFLAGFLAARETGIPGAGCLCAAVAAGAAAVAAGVVGRIDRRQFGRSLDHASLREFPADARV